MSRTRVDVLIAGSGFGGSICAYRLAELYRAADVDPARIMVVERGEDRTEFRQSMHIEYLSRVYELIQGQGAQVVVAKGAGGGSNVYLAASLRSPSETFERRDGGEHRRMWPRAISRATLNRYYRRAELGLRVQRPTWNQVSRSGGLWAATLDAAGHTCDRVPLAIDERRCVDAKWCHTGCIFGAKNSLITNYLGAARKLGVRLRAQRELECVRPSSARPYRWIASLNSGEEIECKVLVLATGAMNDAPVLMRSRLFLPGLSDRVGKHLGMNGDHVAAIEYDPQKVRDVLGLPGYGAFYMGKPITTMTYDFWIGRRDGERFTLQEIFLSPLTNLLYDDGRAPAGEPSWYGRQKKDAIGNWSNRIELLAMVEDTHDGEFLLPSPTGGGAVRPNDGPLAVGTFLYRMSEQSLRVRAQADAAIAQIAATGGLGRFMKLTETQGVYAAHPLGGCRMADAKDLGVVDDGGAVFDQEGLYCMGSSIVPTSLGVNPSLTIAALAERCAERLVARGAERYGLPARPEGFRPGVPAEIIAGAGQPGG